MQHLTVRYDNRRARLAAEGLYSRYGDLATKGSQDKAVLLQLSSEIQDQIDNTNIRAFAYPFSLLIRAQILISADLDTFIQPNPPEDVHEMGPKDLIGVISEGYYGTPEAAVLIQRNNRIYNTDEALLKGHLKVINPDSL